MKQCCASQRARPSILQIASRGVLGFAGFSYVVGGVYLNAQAATNESLEKQVQQLTEAMTRTQAQLEQSQRELQQIRDQLAAVQQEMARHDSASASSSAAQLSAAVEEIREQQAVQESQIATHEQSKVESESKYPIKLNGLVLLNGFVNTRQVDMPATPTVVMSGSGSTGASIRQTVLGVDARGPHLFNARSHADVSVDFYGSELASNDGSASAYAGGLLRLRTAHAALQWEHTEASVSLDHPIINPNSPTSLTAVAIPGLAWSGNLWTWNPQVGISHDISLSSAQHLRAQAALIDIANPPAIYNVGLGIATPNYLPPSTAERSRWPGVEGRIALVGAQQDNSLQIGVGGLFAPHRTLGGTNFDSWAATLDYFVPFAKHMVLSGNVYRGLALGGLGGGAYKDYVFFLDPNYPFTYYFRALDDVGGWAQLKAHAGDHFDFNFAFGTDQVFASQLRPYAGDSTALYLNLARNQTYTGNVIYTPSAYLLFSLEYRHLASSPVNGSTNTGDVIGIATGYRF